MTKIKMFQSGELQDLQESIDNFCESHEVVDVKITSSTVCNIYDKNDHSGHYMCYYI